MRRLLLLTVCFLTASVLFAGPVTKEQAQQLAQQFLQGKGMTHRAPSLDQMKTEVVLDAVDEEGHPYLYAVTQGKDNGFVIVSGDDRFRGVLGYSKTGSFDTTNMPDNMRAWLQGYVDEIRHLKAIGYQPSGTTARRASGVKKAISPLIQTQWNQSAPYNDICKEYFVYKDAVTGCVATAMAQVMYYTAKKIGQSSYTTVIDIPSYTTGHGYSVPAIAAGKVINWNDMIEDYTYHREGSLTVADFNSTQASAVATLMQCCGVSVQMDYANSASGGSGADTRDVAEALKKYFGYDETVEYLLRSSFSYSQWTEMVYAEIANGRPVLYSGQSSGGGHAFIVDGYDGDEMFHVNWGWGGNDNGHFALSVMNPHDNSGIGASTSSDGYSMSQGAVVGIEIGSGKIVTPDPATIGVYSFTVSGTSILLSAFNWTGSSQIFDVGIGTYDEEGNISVIKILKENWSLALNQGDYDLPCEFTTDMAKAGQVVKVFPISKLSSESEWATSFNTNLRYVEVVYDASGNPTLTLHPVEVNLVAESFSFTGSKYKNEVQPIDVSIRNNGDEYYGNLYLFASTDPSNKGSVVSYGGVTIGKTASVGFEWKPLTTGTFTIWVTTDSSGEEIVGKTTVSISLNPHAPAGPFAISGIGIENLDETSWTVDGEGNITGDALTTNLVISPTITNISESNYGSASFKIEVYKDVSGSWNKLPSSYTLSISGFKSGTSNTWSNLDFGTVEYGRYNVRLTNGSSSYDQRYILNLTKGYSTVGLDGKVIQVKTAGSDVVVSDDIAAVNLMGFDFTTITPNSNPNTLYIISSTQSAPAGLTGKNVVKDGQIAELSIVDGHAFASPINFHADKVTYTRTFDKFYDGGKGWTTIVLPFAATKVKNSEGTLPWDVENRKFWLMEFSGEAGSTVNFTTPTTLAANTPYIIALPGDDQGALSLTAADKHTLTFSADNADIKANAKSTVTVSKYKFVGTMTNTGSLDDIYALNGDGDKFTKGTATVEPFRAYFAGTSAAATATSLGIGFGDGISTGIESLQLAKPEAKREGIYNLNGQRVSQPRKGLYIVNGKKVVIK